MKKLDMRVYVLTERVAKLGRTHEQVAAAAILGGATMIQFRDKRMEDREFAATAANLLRLTRAAGIPLIVNDRVEIGVELGADGVHIGRNDGDTRAICQSLPHGMIFGVSATNYAEAIAMDGIGADYLGVGPVFPTGSKEDATSPTGLEELARICRAVKTPVVAIGGINEMRLPGIIEAGVVGAAVISAISQENDMTEATGRLLRVWKPSVFPRSG